MKNCEDCMMNTICTYYDKEQKKTTDKCPGWRWFKRCWGILLISLLLTITGCSNTEATYSKDGTVTVRRTRIFMTEDIDSFSYDARDGSFTLDGYRSDMTRMIDLVDRLTKNNEEENPMFLPKGDTK